MPKKKQTKKNQDKNPCLLTLSLGSALIYAQALNVYNLNGDREWEVYYKKQSPNAQESKFEEGQESERNYWLSELKELPSDR